MSSQRTAPFLKWVGGKSQLLQILSRLITNKSLTYYEPFLGGGAVFFHFADHRRFQRAVLSDTNSELINCYQVVRDNLKDLLKRLDAYHSEPGWNTQEYFGLVKATEYTDPVEQAARTIYLNKTAFNGLYRVNQAGKFNSPFGKYSNPSLYNRRNITACSEALQRFATLRVGDFSAIVKDAQAGDLVYFDPPYVPVSSTSNFTSYAADQFGLERQQALAILFRELFDHGVIVIQSNSDTPLVRKLYGGFDLHIVRAKRSINSKGDARGEINELVIVGKPTCLKIDVPATNYLPDIYPLECPDCGTMYSSSDIICPKCKP
jgi:DNA adenine methylase